MSQDSNNVIVTKVYIEDTPKINSYIEESSFVVKSGIQGPPGFSGSLLGLADVDSSNLENGSTLIFKTSKNKFETTRLLEDQIINSGQY